MSINGSESYIDENNITKLNGKPFFPIGLYGVHDNISEDYIKEISDAGINTIIHYNLFNTDIAEYMLNKLENHPIMLIDLNYIGMCGWPAGERKSDTEWERIKRIKDYPSYLGWHISDEPTNRNCELEWIEYDYSKYKSIDDKHIVWLNHIWTSNKDYLSQFSRFCDISGIDCYPVSTKPNDYDIGNQTISSVGDYVKLAGECVEYRKPIWACLQAFDWDWYLEGVNGILPTYKELKFMTWYSIVKGANGILFWGICYNQIHSQIWLDTMKVASEIHQFSRVLIEPNIDNNVTINSDKCIECIVKRFNNETFIFMTNSTNEKISAVITMSDKNIHMLYKFSEQKDIFLYDSKFKDEFDPYSVHIYSTSKILPQPIIVDKPKRNNLNINLPYPTAYTKHINFEKTNWAAQKNGGVAKASSEIGPFGKAESVNDGIKMGLWREKKAWMSDYVFRNLDSDVWIEVAFDGKKTINRVVVYNSCFKLFDYIIPFGVYRYKLQCFLDNEWVTICDVNERKDIYIHEFEPVETNKIRVLIEKNQDDSKRADIQVYGYSLCEIEAYEC